MDERQDLGVLQGEYFRRFIDRYGGRGLEESYKSQTVNSWNKLIREGYQGAEICEALELHIKEFKFGRAEKPQQYPSYWLQSFSGCEYWTFQLNRKKSEEARRVKQQQKTNMEFKQELVDSVRLSLLPELDEDDLAKAVALCHKHFSGVSEGWKERFFDQHLKNVCLPIIRRDKALEMFTVHELQALVEQTNKLREQEEDERKARHRSL